jgi:SagB-type dehydrogenase family enzyme
VGRWLRDGNLEIQGRADFQLKIGGHRIEPGEIEAALRQHPEVGETVVGAAGAERGGRQLVAWVVPRSRRGSARPAGAAERPAEPFFDALGEGVILDPVQRIELKLRQAGLRRRERDQPELRLPGAEIDEGRRQAYRARVSTRWLAPDAVPLAQLGRFLSSLQQMRRDDDPMPKYRYPSAGSLYPVQTYLHVKPGRVEGVDGGIYVYDPVEHRLLLLTAGAEIGAGVHVEHNRPVFEQAAFSLFLIGKLGAITPIYGKQLGRELSLLEAGYIGQLLMTSAVEAGLGICPIGALNFDAVRDLFRLDEDHLLLHSLLGGLPGAAAATPGPEAESAEDEPLVAELRDHLSRKLPSYMVPSAYVLLDALPLSPNGKVDRRALPVPGALRPKSDVPLVLPRNDLERRLAEIVQRVLGVETVGIHHNFFELGANSVSLVQIHNRLKQELEIDVPIVEMFRRPTISHLAQQLSDGSVAALSFDKIEEEAQRRRQRRLERRREKGSEGPEP